MTPEDLRRLEELETRLTYQEVTISELSKQIYEQQLRIDRYEAHFAAMKERIKTLEEGGHEALPKNERPPHY